MHVAGLRGRSVAVAWVSWVDGGLLNHHFGHANIIRYCARPFADAMNRAMVDRWNNVVADSDEVWVLGDLVMGQLTVNLSAHVWCLKGRKILVPGTHRPLR